MTATKSNQQRALDAFCRNVSEARALATMISRHLEADMGITPDKVDWADASEAAHVVGELKNAARFMNLIAEEANPA